MLFHFSIVGTFEQIIQRIHVYQQAGVEELILQWFDFDGMESLHAFATSVLPRVS